MFVSTLRRSSGRTAFTMIAAAAAFTLLACGAGGGGTGDDISGPPDPPSDNIYGTWYLVSVSGEPLPARVNQYRDSQLHMDVKNELVRGFVTLKHDETFEFAFVSRATVGSIVGDDILLPAEGVFQGGAWVRSGNVLRRVRGPGQPADSLVLTGSGQLQWVVSFPQGPPGSTVTVGKTLTYIHDAPPE